MDKNIELIKKVPEVESIIQFGSSIKRKNYRDIDICIFTKKKISLKRKLELVRDLPQKYDVNFYEDLPLNLKKEVLSKGKVLFTKNYLNILRKISFLDREYPRYSSFLKDYHKKRVKAL
tara:strand:- start:939 stop:1295 length:357 start_codon:yes stop_codon:yes gene_type:complete